MSLLDPRMWLILAIAAVCLYGGGFVNGHYIGAKNQKNEDVAALAAEHARAEKDRAVLAATVSATIAAAQTTENALQKQLADAKANVRVVFQTITKEVPTYVTPLADSRCIVPVGFVRLHDDAARGAVPDVAAAAAPTVGGAFDSPSGIALSEVGRTVTVNYESYHELEATVAGWQHHWNDVVLPWYAKLQASAHLCK